MTMPQETIDAIKDKLLAQPPSSRQEIAIRLSVPLWRVAAVARGLGLFIPQGRGVIPEDIKAKIDQEILFNPLARAKDLRAKFGYSECYYYLRAKALNVTWDRSRHPPKVTEKMLRYLEFNKDLWSVNDISDKEGVTKQEVSRVLRRAEKIGFTVIKFGKIKK